MSRAKKLVRLPNKLSVNLQNFRTCVEKSWFVCHHIERHTRAATGIKIDFPEIPAGDDGRVCQSLERYGLEADVRGIPGSHVQCGAELPAIRQLQTGIKLNLPREISSGI